MTELNPAIEYVMKYGGRCRDCADEDGICPHDGTPCDPQVMRSAIKHALQALEYGVSNGFIESPFPHPTPAPCDELETVGCVSSIYINDPEHGYDEIFKRVSPSEDLIPLVTRQNAEEVIAAKDARIAELEEHFAEMTRSCLAEGERNKVLEADNKRLREALEFYKDGFSYHPKRTKTGIDLSEWKPTEKLLDDCGETARAALGEVKP